MKCEEVIKKLQELSSEKYKANVIKLGIPEENSIGVSTGDVRALAKKIGKLNELAEELWNTGLHEAKLLAVLIIDRKTFDSKKVDKMIDEVYSWDLCDHLCKNLIVKLNNYNSYIHKWCDSEKIYIKRAAYTLIASASVHDKKITNNDLDDYLSMIKEFSNDERDHVKKSISWALREIGKKDFIYQEKALILAHEMKENGSKAQAWIAKDAIKELEKLTKVEGRGRLISTDSKMGRSQ